MKAITVTADNKARNPKYLGTSAIGQIKIFTQMPKVWRTENWTKEAFDLAVSFHEEAGFYEVVAPAYNSNTHKLGELFFDVDKFTYPIIALTQQELDAKVEQVADGEASTTESTRQNDGDAEARYIFKNLRRLNNDGVLTDNQFKASQDLLFDALLPMIYGLWDVSKTRLDAIPNPVNATLLNVLTTIRARIDFYVANNIRQDE